MLHFEILDSKRKTFLPQIIEAGAGFYLAGGTALALHIGHRDSIDFDFFSTQTIDTVALWKDIEHIFVGNTFLKTQEEENTLSCLIAEDIRVSLFSHKVGITNG